MINHEGESLAFTNSIIYIDANVAKGTNYTFSDSESASIYTTTEIISYVPTHTFSSSELIQTLTLKTEISTP